MKIPRRQFVRNAALAAAAFTIVPRHVLGGPRRIAPSDRVNIAGVGVGGMGRANMQALSGMNLVAMCDVDWSYVDARYADIPKQIGSGEQAPGRGDRRKAEGRRYKRRSRAGSSCRKSGRRPSATPTTARCSRSRRTSTRWSSPRRITRMRSSRLRPWTSANTCTCRSRSRGPWRNAAGSRRRPPPPNFRHRWATRGTPPTMRGWSTNTSSPAPSAPSPKCTCGPIGRSPTGRREFRALLHCRRTPRTCPGT